MSSSNLTRSRSHRVIAGVCGGIAEHFDIDPLIVRLIAVVLGLFSVGAAGAAYVVAWLAIPDEANGESGADELFDRINKFQQKQGRRSPKSGEGPSDSFSAD